ncbi:MAG TPA: matrixin family metalloprotease [Candidatus Polarisedimenticolia bacterium]|nr:matrixin family metalloprotease [Candidatus Polarisedimenticolia bacterium]
MNRATAMKKNAVLLGSLAVTLLLATSGAAAYCLIGVRWPSTGNIRYNPNGKVTSGQCISASQMDSAVTGGITPWKPLRYLGTTSNTANKRDGMNVVGWANLGGQTLGVTNFLRYDRQATVSCNGNLFSNLIESDVRITTTYRWTSGGGQCPCAAGSAFYLNGVSEHEFGHVTGLCHTNNPNSLMYPSFGVCENKSSGSDENAGENALCY